jgi:hypothetical protein
MRLSSRDDGRPFDYGETPPRGDPVTIEMPELPKTPSHCLVSDAPWSGAASLGTISAFHGIALTLPEVPKLGHLLGEMSNQEGTALVMGRALGYDAVAMEGEYENLPEVLLPMLVALREGGVDRYAVLFAVTDAEATLGDPRTGEVTVWPRERFAAFWTGSVIQLTPVPEERRALQERVEKLRDRVHQALLRIGWVPPYPRKIAMLVAWVLVFGVAALAPRPGAFGARFVWLVAAACAGSLWSWLASDACGSCSYAHRLAGGLPVALAGTSLYALLLASAFAPAGAGTRPAVTVAIGVALGAHAALVRELWRSKVACWACIFVAASAAGAAAVALRWGASPFLLLISALVVALVAAGSLPLARARQARTWRATAERLARDVIAEPRREGVARLVAFTRKGCTACAFYHAAIKPALLATFGDAIAIDERDLGRANAVAPLLIVLGAPPAVFVGLPSGDSCARMIEAMQGAVDGQTRSTGQPPGRQEMIVHEA